MILSSDGKFAVIYKKSGGASKVEINSKEFIYRRTYLPTGGNQLQTGKFLTRADLEKTLASWSTEDWLYEPYDHAMA